MADDAKFTQADIDKAVQDAVAKVQDSISKLETKNEELVGELRTTKAELRKSKDIDPADLAKLEEENEKLRADLSTAQADVKKLTTERDKAVKAVEDETGFTSKLLIDNGLNAALAEAGVTDPDYLAAAKSMMSGGAQVVTEDGKRLVKLGDKALPDYVKEWAGTEPAKKFISAPGNSGGGAGGGKGSGEGGKTVTRSQFDNMSHSERSTFSKDGGKVVDEAA